ncbi:unnamed protein product [Microthlaspi erraticum]|uniref:Uncharacterized protein n=1 Tax=Microthlaspi erraticum TaxID=1685480 RepID=A0A6D2JUR9_9BRAS|nr:unnamed protein product [Microthlaspi erraticum]
MPITRERGVQHPTTLPFIAMPSQEEALLKSMRTMKKKKESMRNNLNDEDEEQSIDINASQNRAWIHQALETLVSHQEVKLLHFQDLEAMQRPSPPTEEEDTWQYDPIDPNKISPMKLKEFNAKVKSLPFYVTFEEAWDKHGLVEFFFTTSENKEEIHNFQEGSISHCPSWSQSTTITTIITTSGMSIPYQERSLLSSISLSKVGKIEVYQTLNQFNAPASTLDGARKRSTQWISSRPVPCVL